MWRHLFPFGNTILEAKFNSNIVKQNPPNKLTHWKYSSNISPNPSIQRTSVLIDMGLWDRAWIPNSMRNLPSLKCSIFTKADYPPPPSSVSFAVPFVSRRFRRRKPFLPLFCATDSVAWESSQRERSYAPLKMCVWGGGGDTNDVSLPDSFDIGERERTSFARILTVHFSCQLDEWNY